MHSPYSKLAAFPFDVFRSLGESESPIRGQKLLIACSGGLDSIVLIEILAALQSRLNLTLGVAHIHHGFSVDPTVVKFRDEALRFVQAYAAEKNLKFVFAKYDAGRELRSENDLRKFRLATLNSMIDHGAYDRVVLGHHADDLLETRLMRLIRGTGPQGLRAMHAITTKTCRPFLNFPKARLREFAVKSELSWIEDASNSDSQFLRNWIRGVWLPMLENNKKGSTHAFARSLDLLVGHLDRTASETVTTFTKFNRSEFGRLPMTEKQDRLARLGRALDVKNFSASKVDEILKRLNRLETTKQKSTSFQVGGLVWKIDSDEISVTKP